VVEVVLPLVLPKGCRHGGLEELHGDPTVGPLQSLEPEMIYQRGSDTGQSSAEPNPAGIARRICSF